jgi:hypothetical protein
VAGVHTSANAGSPPVAINQSQSKSKSLKGCQMSEAVFWSIIDKTIQYKADPEMQISALERELMTLSAEEIVAFESAFTQQINSAYTWKLWGAASLVHGGASDDGFEYFRRWLLAQGSRVFKEVVERPDNLADFISTMQEEPLEFEEFGSVAVDAWAKRSGRSWEDFPMPTNPDLEMGTEPRGSRFEESEEYFQSHYPKLWRRFGEQPLG